MRGSLAYGAGSGFLQLDTAKLDLDWKRIAWQGSERLVWTAHLFAK